MNRFEIFNNNNLGSVRTMYDAETGEVWFFANDILEILGYTDMSHTLLDHTSSDDRKALKYADWVKLTETESHNRRERIFVNESGLYCLIFGSDKPKAQDFKFWVTKEVLPSIRKHGGYVYGQENLSDEERRNLLVQVEKLSKSVAAYKEDSDLWMKMYFDLQKEYLAAVENAVPVEKTIKAPVKKEAEVPAKDDKIEYVKTAEGFIMTKELYLSLKN